MCNLYNITSSREAMQELFRILEGYLNLGNFQPQPATFPDYAAPVVRTTGSQREALYMRWGFPPAPGKGTRPITNVRRLDSPYWRHWLNTPQQRCLVPASSFCESKGKAPASYYWFALKGDEPRPLFAFAGVWRHWKGVRKKAEGEMDHSVYSFLTTEPNELISPIHPKSMPVIVRPEDYETWLLAPWNEAKELVQSYPAEQMHIVRQGVGENADEPDTSGKLTF